MLAQISNFFIHKNIYAVIIMVPTIIASKFWSSCMTKINEISTDEVVRQNIRIGLYFAWILQAALLFVFISIVQILNISFEDLLYWILFLILTVLALIWVFIHLSIQMFLDKKNVSSKNHK